MLLLRCMLHRESMLILELGVVKSVLIKLTRTKTFPTVHPGATIVGPVGIGASQVAPATGRFRRVNPKMREFTGYSEDELLGIACSLVTHPHDWEEVFERFRRMARGEMSEYVGEQRYPRKHGSVAG